MVGLNTTAAHVRGVEMIHEGDRQGNGAVLELRATSGRTIFALGIPQAWHSATGPTWVYLVEEEGLTLVDAGGPGTHLALQRALGTVGVRPEGIRRVIITHGHHDHDGGVEALTQAGGAEVWAHEAYPVLKSLDSSGWRWGEGNPLMHLAVKELEDRGALREPSHRRSGWETEAKPQPVVTHPVWEGRRAGDLVCWQTPGHSPDELTISLEGFVFTGDHVLPEITPHPTFKTWYAPEAQGRLPQPYRNAEQQYGLATYLASLGRVAALGEGATILPGHRLLSKGRLNLLSARRASDIMEHHVQRMHRITSIVGSEPQGILYVTDKLFSYRPPTGDSYYPALAEVVAHVEFMVDSCDLSLTEDRRLLWRGTEHFREAVRRLHSSPGQKP